MDIISNGYENLKVLAKGSFPADITRIDNVVPVEYTAGTAANAVAVDFLAAVANHLYFVTNLSCWEVAAITGTPLVQIYDILAFASNLISPNFAPTFPGFHNPEMFCTRLAHLPNGASGGTYMLSLLAYDITYA